MYQLALDDKLASLRLWRRGGKSDLEALDLADRHYSRQQPGTPQFMPPGETLVLVGRDRMAVFGWVWQRFPKNGLDGWTCSIFRNEGAELSSELIFEAEAALVIDRGERGPDGLITYVWPSRVRSPNPGYCFKIAGWRQSGTSADGQKLLFQKPWSMAGLAQ